MKKLLFKGFALLSLIMSLNAHASEICGKIVKIESSSNESIEITILTDENVREKIVKEYTLYRGLNPGQMLPMIAYLSGDRFCNNGKKTSVINSDI